MSASLPAGTGEDIMRRISRTFSSKSRHENDIELENANDSESTLTKVGEWRLANDVKDIQQNDPVEGRKLGVTWTGLTVKVVPSDTQVQENVFSQFNIPQQIKESRQKRQLKTILDSSWGNVQPGEMLLVLGRPGSGCTTLLRMLANQRKGYDLHISNVTLV